MDPGQPEQDFLHKVADSLSEHLVVIDREGKIVFVNRAWNEFGELNASPVRAGWLGENYLAVCEGAARGGDDFGRRAAQGLRRALAGGDSPFYLEYPCHGPDQQRWFMMRVTPFEHRGERYCVVSHQNITERVLAEHRAMGLARIDSLSGLPNRRFFDEFLSTEWRRCKRLKAPLTLAMVDIDHFKLFNDRYGHSAGDRCLARVAEVLGRTVRRPGDFVARYGGEEFVLVFGQSQAEQVRPLLDQALAGIRALAIPHETSPVADHVTISAGIATACPESRTKPNTLIDEADALLYAAKQAGRDRVVIQEAPAAQESTRA